MAFASLLGQRFVVGIGTSAKAAERSVRYALDNLVGAGDEVILCHIIALSPNALTFADARAKTVRTMVDRRIAHLFNERCVSFCLKTVQISLPFFMGQNPAFLIAHALATKAAGFGAAALVVGGSGKDNLALTILMGHSISYTVAHHANMPVVLVGARCQPQAPDLSRVRLNPDMIPSLAIHDVIAAAA